MKLKSFTQSKKYEGYTVIVVTKPEVDELTGVEVVRQYCYLYIGNCYFSNYIGREVELKLVKSPKLGFDVCTGIKTVATKPVEQPTDLSGLIEE